MNKNLILNYMIISISNQKYKCGCNIGMSKLEKQNVLSKLNTIIEWDVINKDVKEGKDKITELKPGDCFLFDGQIIAVDSKDCLVLLFSETGFNSLERIYNDVIILEFNLLSGINGTEEVTWESIKDEDEKKKLLEEFDGEYQVPYNIYKEFRDHFIARRGFTNEEGDFCIKAQITSDLIIIPVDILLLKWKIKYKSSQSEERDIKFIVNSALSWFYNNYKRVIPKEPEEKEEEEEIEENK